MQVKGLVSFQSTGTNVRKDKRKRTIENKVVRMQKNSSRFESIMARVHKARKAGFLDHAEKLAEMAKQFC